MKQTARQCTKHVCLGVAAHRTLLKPRLRLQAASWSMREGKQRQYSEDHTSHCKCLANEILAEDAYQRMRQLSESAPRHQMHLTLSELFNLTFVIGRFEEFTQMLDDLKARLGDGAISYVWLLQAQVLLGNGGSTHVSRAVTELEQGLRLLQDESPSAVWYGESVEQAQLVLAILARHPGYADTVSQLRTEHPWLKQQLG